MSVVAQLVGFGLRQVIGDFADNAVQIVGAVEQRFRDHSQTLPKALDQAHQRAWQALGVALAGDGLLDRVKVFFASGDDKGVREQVQLFLNSNAVSFDGAPADFRRDCLDELKRLRKSGLLAVQGGSAAEIARQAAGFRRHADPQGLVEEARRAVAGVADALAEGYPNLARLLRTPTPAGPPLLAAAFCYFFRREVETDDELAHGLFFDGLRQLSASQAKAFGEVGKALAALGGQFDAVFEQLDRVEAAVAETHAVAVETHGAVLDVQAELQRLGGLHLANAGEVRKLLEQVLLQLGQAGMARGEVRPGNSCSIRGEDERRAVKALLARFRGLPAEEQARMPALLNGLGKLQVGTGDFAEARQTFAAVVRVVGDPSGKAEASFNAYRAALEERQWDAALAALREAASLDPKRFAPFPLHRYEPKRILGAGGFGTAILCLDRHFDEDVVVKTLHAADLARGVDEVFREARILRRLSHPAIIGVRDCEYADPAHKARPYLVMDYFPGGTLQDVVDERGPLGLENLLSIAVQAAEGVHAAHAQGVLHRDLKPANLLVLKEGALWKVKIIDFGLALRQQTIDTSKVRIGAVQKSMLDWSVVGTLDYAPPEQLGKLPGIPPGPYSDVFAFGKMCLYSLFKITESSDRLWKETPAPGRAKLRKFLEQCIERDLSYRLRSFEPVVVALEGMKRSRRGAEQWTAWEAAQRRPDDNESPAREELEAERQHQREAVDLKDRQEEQSRLEDNGLKALLEKGKDKGYLTYDQVNDHLPDLPEDDAAASEKIDKILILLEDQGIELIEESEAERRREQEEAERRARAEAELRRLREEQVRRDADSENDHEEPHPNRKKLNSPEVLAALEKVFVTHDISVLVPGTWYVRATNEDEAWVRVAETPRNVRISPGRSYKLEARDGVGDEELFGLTQLRDLFQPEALVINHGDLTDEGLISLCDLTQLEELHLRNCPGVKDAGMRYVAALEGLRELNLSGTGVTDNGLETLAVIQGLQTLILEKCEGVTDEGLKKLATMEKLRELNLSGTGITDDGLKELAALKGLQELDLDNTKVTDAGLKNLAALKDLQTLSLICCVDLTDAGLKEVAALKGLQTLVLSGDGVTDAGLKEVAHLQELKKLYLGFAPVTDGGLKELASLKGLRTLFLAGTQVTGASLKELAALKRLRWLDLSFTKTTDAGLKDLAMLKGLQELFLASTDVTDAGLKSLADLKGLRTLGLDYTKVTDAGLKELVVLKELKKLWLSECPGVTGVGVAALQNALPNCYIAIGP